jgi:hypothetical protein
MCQSEISKERSSPDIGANRLLPRGEEVYKKGIPWSPLKEALLLLKG